MPRYLFLFLEPYKEALKRLLDDEIERGHFVDQPFDDNDIGQETGKNQDRQRLAKILSEISVIVT